uniref:Cytochrome c oxidase subunit NDUFA4 n=1 Tax=Takifugu rubripes TaxID=31033 RepID=A0A674P7C3_TAKRU
MATLGRCLTDRQADTDRQVLSLQCGIGCQRWGGRVSAPPDPPHTRAFSDPQHFSSRRNQDRQWIITRHVVDVRGHSETAEEPPGSDPSLRFIGGGATMSMLYLSRLALRNPDVSWDRKNNPEPWNKMEPTQQYKLFAVNMDYSKLKKDRPDF